MLLNGRTKYETELFFSDNAILIVLSDVWLCVHGNCPGANLGYRAHIGAKLFIRTPYMKQGSPKKITCLGNVKMHGFHGNL